MVRKILSVILAAAVSVSMLHVRVLAEDGAANGFAGGSGTKTDPYRIETAEQLQKLAADVNGGNAYEGIYFELTEDIDLSGVCSEEKGTWTPIGNSFSTPFTDTFNGGDHKITGLYIYFESGDYNGFFGRLGKGGTVQNLSVYGCVKGDSDVGGIVGFNQDGMVENCYNSCSISGTSYLGGIIGTGGYGTL